MRAAWWSTGGGDEAVDRGEAKATAKMGVESGTGKRLLPSFTRYRDDDGDPYFVNDETGASVWEVPEGSVVVDGEGD